MSLMTDLIGLGTAPAVALEVGQKLVLTCQTVAQLRLFQSDGYPSPPVITQGRVTVGDGLSGEYIVNPTDTTSPDNGSTIIVDATLPVGRRWYLQSIITSTVTTANIVGGTAGALPYQTSPSNTAFSAAGTAGQLLLSGGTGAPVWASPASLASISTTATVASLRLLTTTTYPAGQIQTTGYGAQGDGGSGTYVVNAADTTSSDNGGTIIVDASLRRWYLQIQNNRTTARQWGCYGDEGLLGASAHDDTLQLQAALDWLVLGVGRVYLPGTPSNQNAIAVLDLEHLSYYVSAVNVGVTFVPAGPGTGFSVTAPVITQGTITTGALVITNAGSGYTPNVSSGSLTIVSYSGYSATATYSTNSSGQVTAANVTAGGFGYQYGALSLGMDTNNTALDGPWVLRGNGPLYQNGASVGQPGGTRLMYYGAAGSIDAVLRLSNMAHRTATIDGIAIGCQTGATATAASGARRAIWIDGSKMHWCFLKNIGSTTIFDVGIGVNAKNGSANGEFLSYENIQMLGCKSVFNYSNGAGEPQIVEQVWKHVYTFTLPYVPSVTATVTTSTGTGAVIVPVVTFYNSTPGANNGAYGQILRYQILNGGSNYTAADPIALNTNGGPGSGATATCNVNASGVITSITVSAVGSAYQGTSNIFHIGGGASPIWGLTAYDINSSTVPNPYGSQHTYPMWFLENEGSQDSLNFFGGRVENKTGLVNISGADFGMSSINFTGMTFTGLAPSKNNPFYVNSVNSAGAGYRVTFTGCGQLGGLFDQWSNTGQMIPSIYLGTGDHLLFDRCWGTVNRSMSVNILGGSTIQGPSNSSIKFKDCGRFVTDSAGNSMNRKFDWNYNFSGDSDTQLQKRSDDFPATLAHRGALTNLIGNPDFFLSTVDGGGPVTAAAVPYPWTNYGNTLTVSTYVAATYDANYTSFPSAAAIFISPISGVQQDLGPVAANTNLFYQAQVAVVNFTMRFALEDSNTGFVYDEITIANSGSNLQRSNLIQLSAMPVVTTGTADPSMLQIIAGPLSTTGTLATFTFPGLTAAGGFNTGALTVSSAGSGYPINQSGVALVFQQCTTGLGSPAAPGSGAVGTYNTNGSGQVSSATITTGGSGYTNLVGDVVLCIYNTDSKTGDAAVRAFFRWQFAGTDINSTFTQPPSVTSGQMAVLTAPGGTGTPKFSYTLTAAGGFGSVYILNGGTGGLSNGNLTITAGIGSGATIPYTVTSGVVTGIGSITAGTLYVGPGHPTTNSVSQTTLWGQNTDSANISGRLQIPYKHNQFGAAPGALPATPSAKSDVYVSSNETTAIFGERFNYYAGATDAGGLKNWQVPRGYYAAAAPGSGTWAVGDIVWNTAPAHLGNIGWVCTTAGTPGTWYQFGAIL